MNSIHIKGRLVRDPDIRSTDSGKQVANISVAVNRRFQKDKADFFNVTAWEKSAEFLNKYFRKGQEIIVEGEMQSREYTDKDGNKCTVWDIRAENIEFCGSKNESGGSASPVPSAAAASAPEYASADTGDFTEIPTDDDLPF